MKSILFITGKVDTKSAREWFKSHVHQSPFLHYFTELLEIDSNRVMIRQLTTIHKESGIECLICFAHKPPSINPIVDAMKIYPTRMTQNLR